MSALVPDAALTHIAIDEVLQLLLLSGNNGGARGAGSADGSSSSTGSLPGGMRAWIAGTLMVVEAAGAPPF